MTRLNYDSQFGETRCLEDMLKPDFINEISGCIGDDWYIPNVPINSQDLRISIQFEFNHHDEDKKEGRKNQ